MSEEESWGFAPPPFKAAEALVQLQRALRDQGLKEREQGFEQAGKRVLEYELGEGQIAIRLAQRLQTNTPNWDRFTLKSAADQRKLLDEVKKRLARWRDED
ncbi:hypothetical protein [Inhella sp.]|uniref:hypothetical protein n=1 Tax=Inhella sp. TaxID=1921806 RepID=UPI0035AE92AD